MLRSQLVVTPFTFYQPLREYSANPGLQRARVEPNLADLPFALQLIPVAGVNED